MKPTSIDYRQVGQRIRKARHEQGLTLEQLAHAAGISLSYLGHIERGTRSGSVETYLSLADHLRLSLDYLLRGLSLWDLSVAELNPSDDRSDLLREMIRVLSEEKGEWRS